MRIVSKAIGVIGFFLFFFGGCLMDSEDLTIPVAIMIIGMLLFGLYAWNEKNYVDY